MPLSSGPRRFDSSAADFEPTFADFLAETRMQGANVGAVVAEIIAAVRNEGDAAVERYSLRFDRLQPGFDPQISAEEIAAAKAQVPQEILAALALAAERIEAFHARQYPQDHRFTDSAGAELGWRWTAVAAAGLYVPGGKAAYPSSLLMNAIPAKVAGVERRVMVVPAPDGEVNPLVLAAAELAGITEAYRIGGAQAVAALAYGTERIRPVDKIVGPGNAFVAEAKRQVFGRVGIDSIAGPSEVMVVADRENDPDWIAADLLSQCEHDEAAQAILVSDAAAFLDAVADAVERALESEPRAEIARASWEAHGALLLVPSLTAACPLVDRVAPEHLELAVAAPASLLPQIRNAGAIFLGRYTPEAVGDYLAGPNHVLPTDRTARFASGLSVLDFMKRTTLISCSGEAIAGLGEPAAVLADAEGLSAHARSLRIRLADNAG
ncbi:MAG: histidinol dehydrogenase [Rhodospirillales bacterium]|nr:histidinol dehydrogenase [Rhodospirillales bacterium]